MICSTQELMPLPWAHLIVSTFNLTLPVKVIISLLHFSVIGLRFPTCKVFEYHRVPTTGFLCTLVGQQQSTLDKLHVMHVRSSIAFLSCITFVAVCILPCCMRFGWEPGWEELLFVTVGQLVSFLRPTTQLDTLQTCMTLSNFLWDCRLYSLYSIPYNNSSIA